MTDWTKLLPDGQPSYARDDVVYEALKAETAKGFFSQERTTNEVAAHLLGDYPDTLPNRIARTRVYMALAKIAKLGKWTTQGPPTKSRFGVRRPWIWHEPAPDHPSDLALADAIIHDLRSPATVQWAQWVLAHAATTTDRDPHP